MVKSFHGFDKAWILSDLTECLCCFSGVVREYFGGHLFDGHVAGNDDDDKDNDDDDNNNNMTCLEAKINEKNSYSSRRVWPYWPST